MMRKAILILCVLGAIGSSVAWVASYSKKHAFVVSRGPSTRIALIIEDGQVSLMEIGVTTSSLPGIVSAFTFTKPLYRFPIYAIVGGLTAPWLLYGLYRYVLNPTRRYRLRHNLCLGCGYPLKGLPSLICPECGREFAGT